jgi:transcriptional regulator with XRE-family HTH domain
MARPTSPTVSRRELANTLRSLRLRSRKTLEDAAAALEVSAATVSRIETGVRVPRARDVKDLCAFYGVTDPKRVAELAALVADARESGWWESYTEVDEDYATLIGFEQAATAIQHFENALIPGLLQTPDYTRIYLKEAIDPGRIRPYTEQDIEKRIEVRLRRQQVLRTGTDLHYTAVIDEAALLRRVGSVGVMKEQVAQLLTASERPGTSVHLLPLDRGANPGQQGGFVILTMPQTHVSDVVYLELLAGEIFLEAPVELERHRRIFTSILDSALDVTDSQEAFTRIINQYK